MRLARAVSFGFIGAIGVMLVSTATLWLLNQALRRSMSSLNRWFVFIVIGGFGVAVALSFLFGLIDILVDEKLE